MTWAVDHVRICIYNPKLSRSRVILEEFIMVGNIIDIDSHVLEPGDLWDKNLEDMESYIDSIFEKYNKEYSRLLAGETKLINFFIGNIIKESKGRYNPSSITNYLKKKFIFLFHPRQTFFNIYD